MSQLLQTKLNIPEELSTSIIQNSELNIVRLIELYGPEGALGDYVGQAHRRFVLSINALATYMLIPADEEVSPSLVSIALCGCGWVPLTALTCANVSWRGHLGLDQAQDGAPIGPQHVSLLYLRSRMSASSRGDLPRESANLCDVTSIPSHQATRNSPIPTWSEDASRGDRVSSAGPPPDPAFRSRWDLEVFLRLYATVSTLVCLWFFRGDSNRPVTVTPPADLLCRRHPLRDIRVPTSLGDQPSSLDKSLTEGPFPRGPCRHVSAGNLDGQTVSPG
ncbi:hypothetical protein RHMOL_Rhmol03G0136500 [Rhododendron molle]|uniref:Uncharacterized protein n=1 Tax=Rhododendron molle TaxID=49168 RepID=A0ACC0PF65_RHOML|nr:hypothetical protein RHMOL_Rhmol03G0136500 [Rhododendron molle]